MFYELQSHKDKLVYRNILAAFGALSRLFSDSEKPYLYYRAAENIFCKAFNARNLARGDVSADAAKDNTGIGLKTFLHGNGKTFQKIAEFNKANRTYVGKSYEDVIRIVSQMRNDRISFTQRAYDLPKMAYHLVTRDNGIMMVFEEPMHPIDLNSVKILDKKSDNNIIFRDRYGEYGFYLPKSTLHKRFITDAPLDRINVNLLTDPYGIILEWASGSGTSFPHLLDDVSHMRATAENNINLPLYSPKSGKVEEKSGLNEWNAGGRRRHHDEVYIPIPQWIHQDFAGFFPYDRVSDKGFPFSVILPNGQTMSVKVCQQNGKALMSNPNKALGHWLLRDVLRLPPNKLVTYEMLEQIGVDSVLIQKQDDKIFRMDFSALGSYDDFEKNNRKTYRAAKSVRV